MDKDTLTQIVRRYLDGARWHYDVETRPDVTLISAGVGGFSGLYESYRILLVIGANEVQNFALFPANASGAIQPVAEFIARINSRLTFGSFILDCDNGKIQFHQTFPAVAVESDTKNSLDFLVFAPVQMLDRFSKAFSAVITGCVTPLEGAVRALDFAVDAK